MDVAQSEKKSSKPLLLVVDDRHENLEAMQALLGDDDSWELRCVNSGEAALRCLLQEDVTLVLLDVQMPDMDGYEVAHLMRGNPRTRHTPIIFISAIAHTQDSVLKGYSTGAVDFILKPFNPQVLRHKIHNLLILENSRREMHTLSKQLEHERAFNASILSNAAEGILVVGENGLISYLNPSMAKMINAPIEQVINTSFWDLIKEKNCTQSWRESPFYQHWCKSKTYLHHEANLLDADGDTLPVSLSCAPLPHPQRAMVVIMRDISVERDLLNKMESLVVTDPLTGLLNRRGFNQAVESALARVQRTGHHLAVIFIDLDGFKRINDSLGHDAGDELLKKVAAQLKSVIRGYDALARMGGDEFTLLIEGLDSCKHAGHVAEKLLQLISVHYQINGTDFILSASIGVACYPDCGKDVESLLRSADMAMYEAKRAGRARYRFHSSQMTARAHARLELEQNLRKAVAGNHFNLVYQPQFYLDTGKLRGFEALLRWPQNHPINSKQQKVFMPDEFVPLLEETKLINPLGEWIFNEGISKLVELAKCYGDDIILSLNVSPIQFAHSALIKNLERLIAHYQINPAQLEIEVTETALMQNLKTAQTRLQQLRKLGVSVAVDDFGTGYSSLAYLRQFELDILKIDRLFISNMIDSRKDAAIVSTIIDLARYLDLQVIAEGVETHEQRTWLLEHNCAIMQGWLVAPALEFSKALNLPQQIDWGKIPLRFS